MIYIFFIFLQTTSLVIGILAIMFGVDDPKKVDWANKEQLTL